MAIKFLSDVETTSSSTLSIGQLDNPNVTPTEFLVATGSGLVGFRTAAEILSDIGSENSYLQTLAFDTSTGIITASVLNESDVTVDIDGRYLELGGGTITGNLVLDGTFADSNGSVGTSGQVLSSTVTGTDWVDAATGGTNIGNSNLTISGTDTARVLTLSTGTASSFAISDTSANIVFRTTANETTVTGLLTTMGGNSTTGGSVLFKEGSNSGSNYIRLQAPATLAANNNYILPTAYPTTGQVLSSTDAGVMSWVTAGGADTNIANTDLTANANRTLTLGALSLKFLDGSADVIAAIQASGNEFFGTIFSIRTNSTTTAPTLRLSSGTSNSYTGIKSRDTLANSTTYTLPSADGAQGDVLATNGSAELSWLTPSGGSSSPTSVINGGGRITMTTSTDANSRFIIMGGAQGFSYYIWSTLMYSSAPSFTGLGTPGTSTTLGNPYNANNGTFKANKAGVVQLTGTIEFPTGQTGTSYVYVFKLSSTLISNMNTGTYTASATYTLVASAAIAMPTSNPNLTPRIIESKNGETVSASDYLVCAFAFSGTVTATSYFYPNINLIIL
jgi:hypothetical protein